MSMNNRPLSGPQAVPFPSGRDRRPAARKILDYGLLALLVWSPLPAASRIA